MKNLLDMQSDLNEDWDLIATPNSSKVSDSSHKDVIFIVVMGVTGSGKSNFIRHVTGGKGPKVSDELESCKRVPAT